MEMIVSGAIFLLICVALIVGIIANVVKYPPTSEKLFRVMMILLGIGGLGILAMIIFTYLRSL